MGKSSISTLVSVQLANDIAEMVSLRANARGVSRSRFVSLILQQWRDKKYPAIDAIDSTARALVKQAADSEKSKAKNPQHESDPTAAMVKAIARENSKKTASLNAEIAKANRPLPKGKK